MVKFKNLALGVVAVDEDLSIWLVGQYRFPLGLYSWEIPEGGGAENEPPLHAIQRELLEETGLKALNWRIMLTLHLSNSVSDELALIYLATGLCQGEAQPDDTELIHVMNVPFSEAYKAVLEGRITDAMSVAGILRLALLLESGWKPEDETQYPTPSITGMSSMSSSSPLSCSDG
jgi:8-oxo-dGTP pyrophosphatase MutT (NUDIX family)